MREERIVVTIGQDGKVEIDVTGVKGEACLDLTKELEEALGKVTERKEKKEIHEKPTVVTTKRVSDIHRS